MYEYAMKLTRFWLLAMSWIHTFVSTLTNPGNFTQLGREIKSLFHHSFYPGLLLLLLVALGLDMIIMLVSWALVMLIAKNIRKSENAAFEQFGPELYKCKDIWIKIAATVFGFCTAKIGLEGLQFLTPFHVSDENFMGVVRIGKIALIKWMAFVQYLTFYQGYLYTFRIVGSRINPLVKKKVEAAKEFQEKAKADADKKSP